MVFGSSWRNRDARPARRKRIGESRKAGIIVEAFLTKRLASHRDALQFPLRTRRLRLRLIFRRGGNGFVFAIRL